MKTIYIKLLYLLLFAPLSVLAQGNIVGTVVDSKSNQSIPSVNIVVEGSATSTQTDFDGKFALPKLKKGDKIVFSFIGYKNAVVTYDNQKEIMVSLEEDANELKEVVVQVGYGSVKKKDATGSVSLLSNKDFNKGVVTNAEGLLTGRVAGVVVTQGGRPGDGAAIRIRGGSSLYSSNDPLYVIDGLPVEGGISAINPNDIESFSILKDASATAIYGSRASNGVVIITTKKGTKNDEILYSFNSYTALNTVAKKVDVFSPGEFRNIVQQFAPDRVGLLENYDTKWQDQIFSNGFSSNNDLSIRGNLLKTIPTRLSVGYTDIAGVLKTSGFDRTSVSLSMNPTFLDNHLKVQVNANYANEQNKYADEGAIGSAIAFNPTKPIYDANSPFGGFYESYKENGPGSYTVFGPGNPLAMLEQRNNEAGSNRYYGNLQLDYKFHFLEDLRVVVNGGFDNFNKDGNDVVAENARSGMNGTALLGSNKIYWEKTKNVLLDSYLVYNHTFGQMKLDFTAGYSYQNFEEQKFDSGNTLRTDSDPDIYTAPSVNLQGFYGRLNLDFYSKYLVTLNYRADATSRFAQDYRWGNFPGAAVAWKISEEDFLKDSETISNLKLRIGYGVTGQQKIPDAYDYFKRYNLSGVDSGATYPFGDTYYQLAKPEGYNETIQWEETTSYNVGLDFGFLNDKLSGSLDFYDKITNNLVAKVKEGALQNFRTEGPANIGELESKGVELGINYKAISTDKSNLNLNFNVAYNQRKINSLDDNEYFAGGIGLDLYSQILKEGLWPSAFWLYQQIYDANGNPIEGAYVDRNEDGVVNSSDKYAYHKPEANWNFGLMTNYSYEKWDFSMAWRASLGNYIYNDVVGSRAFLSQGIADNNPNAVNNAPVDFTNTQFSQRKAESDYYVSDASWLKWDNVTVGYTFNNPIGYTEKANSLRIYGGIQNVLVISDYKGMDPEIFGGNDSVIYPRARMYMLGVNFNF